MAMQPTSINSEKDRAGDFDPEMRKPVSATRSNPFSAIFILFLLIGSGLASLDFFMPMGRHPFLFVITEHLGVGVIVATVVIVGIEWRSRMRDESDSPLAAELMREARDLKDARDILVSAKGRDSLAALLKLLLPMEGGTQEYRKEMIQQILLLVDNMPRLAKAAIWAPHFITELLKLVVVSNAARLSYLGEPGDQAFVTLTGAEVADMILAAQMQTLGDGDSYDVISHLTAWKDNQLSRLQEATCNATGKGVKVRRIFNLLKENYTLTVEPREARDYLQSHLSDMKRLGADKYEVKIFFPEDIDKIPRFSNDMRRAHFGIFTHQGQRLRVEVTNENLASMKMSRQQEDFRVQSELFEAAWYAIHTTLDQSVIERVVDVCSKGHNSVWSIAERG
jgi:hypothetical protein